MLSYGQKKKMLNNVNVLSHPDEWMNERMNDNENPERGSCEGRPGFLSKKIQADFILIP